MEDFFKKHKIILSIFTLVFLTFVIITACSYRGAFFDSLGHFFAFIDDILAGKDVNYVFLHDYRTRHFSNFLSIIPFNLAIFAGVSDLKLMLKIFTGSFYFMNFVFLITGYLVAKRTKRYDIAVWLFVFYCFFLVPGSVWFTRECRIAIILQFILLMYFLSKEKLSKRDIVPVSLLVVYMFESFETTFLYGIMLFVFALIYYKKNPEAQNIKAKILIGIGSLISSIYIFFMTKHWASMQESNIQVSNFFHLFIDQTLNTFSHFFRSSLIITAIGLGVASCILFVRREFKTKDFCFLIPLVSLILLLLYQNTRLVPAPYLESEFYTLPLLLSIPALGILILFDYKNWTIAKYNKNVYSNLIVLSSIIGILHFGWQINSSFYAYEYVSYLQNVLKNAKKTIVKLPEEAKYKDFYVYDSCFGSMQRSVLFSPEYKVKSIMFPGKTNRDYGSTCYDNIAYTYYLEDEDELSLQYSVSLEVKNQYWDMTKIAKKFKQKGLVKDE